MLPMSHRRRRTAFSAFALLAGIMTSVTPIGAQPVEQAAHAASTFGRPSVDAPDACAALPLEWRLRCQGGRNHTVSDIGAPYDGTFYDASTPPAWHSQWQAVLPADRDRAAAASIDAAAVTAQDDVLLN